MVARLVLVLALEKAVGMNKRVGSGLGVALRIKDIIIYFVVRLKSGC